ncbi:MAG: phosphoribosylanthranilate isomerase [Oscillospiraceae bacterium]|jgi:phosphoribosylanthranilate isomerase|nr:phosphoribosylanthranilate isomerase [Oscillospiraceae bacterium]
MKIKICGLFRDADVAYANETLPDYIGFVFAESRRRVSAQTAARLRAGLDARIAPVGVFADAPIEEVAALVRNGVIDWVQLHGHEDGGYLAALRALCPAPIIQAGFTETDADFMLLDNGSGGTGAAFDWAVIGARQKPFFLAGGINLENIDRAMGFEPYAVDISGGAETDGVKSLEKIAALVQKARERGK